MRLKKIVLVGFKSFAEKTTLNFDAGITCIVGPNGCGKSNISDAFRWVLGEQSAKSLRGNKMPDVIFAGASNRQPLNFAEVSLTLSDIQGALPIDYEEVTITRRLHRSGESEYFINSNPVRLKDIHTLLFDSGIGRNAFSIFEQGKLDQVINYSPNERRYIFEEAAGIVRFLHRKQESFKRLEQTELNLSRVDDIHREVEQQIALLESQAEKALVFKENQLKFELLDKTACYMRWTAWEKKREDADNRLLVNQSLLKEAEEATQEDMANVKTLKDAVIQNEKLWKEENESHFRSISTLQIKKNEQLSIQNRITEVEQRIKKLKRELEDLHLSKKTRQDSFKELEAKKMRIEEQFQEISNKLSGQTEKVKEHEKEVLKIRQDLQIRQQEYFKWMQREGALSGEIKQMEVRLENNEERIRILGNKSIELIEEKTKLTLLIGEKKELLEEASTLVESHKERLDEYEDALSRNGINWDNTSKLADTCRKRLVESQARQKVLIRMQQEMEGFSAGSKMLLRASKTEGHSLFGLVDPLYELLKPTAEYADGLSAVLKNYGQTLVVKTADHLKTVIDFACQEGIDDYSLICLEYIPQNKKGAVKRQSYESLVEQVEWNPLAEHFLGSIAVSDGEEALPFDLTKGWTGLWNPQGIYIDAYGVLFKIGQNEDQIFSREAELKMLEEQIDKLEAELQAIDTAGNLLQKEKIKLQGERAEVDKMLRRDEMKLVEVNFSVQRAMGDLEKIAVESSRAENERNELIAFSERQKAELKERRQSWQGIQQELTLIQTKRTELEEALKNEEHLLRSEQMDEREQSSLYQQLMEDKRRLTHQGHLLESKEQDHEAQVERIQEECAELADHQASLVDQEENFKTEIIELESQLQQTLSQLSERETEGSVLKKNLEIAEKKSFDQQEKVRQLEMQMAQLRTQLEHIGLTLQAIITDLSEKYHLSIEEVKRLDMPLDRSLELIEKQMRALKQQLQEAGDVNLTAIDELDKQRVRHGFLARQLGEIKDTKEELLRIIAQLDAESRRLLRETFDQVRSNFKKNFEILFNGGEADLQFIGNPDNILDAGIEISAKPPGKQMRSISLLSGGEKCLTAVALLFAIFEVKPAPFCILDEIDAPLDDTNVERFVNVVKHFVDRCQFLIITHNKGTMAIGDVIFGVTMEEKGISKLLSLEFSRETNPEAALV